MDVAALLGFEQRLREAVDLAQLSHTIVNQAHNCLPYTQAVLLGSDGPRRFRALSASDIPTVDHTAPFFTWIERLAAHLAAQPQEGVRSIGMQDVPADLQADWQEMSPGRLLWMPLRCEAADDGPDNLLLLFRADPWSDDEQELAGHLAGSVGHALFALKRCRWSGLAWKTLRHRRLMLLVALVLFGLMWVPVRLNALAPVEVVARDPLVISAPIDGAVREVLVMPNQAVQQGELLVQLEDTELSADRQVAERTLLMARAELKTVQQSGFVDVKQKARLSQLESVVRLRQTELEQARMRLDKTRILAPGDGIVVLGDPNEWKGKPVRVGERIMLLADENSVELNIMLPVKDSIALQQGAPVTVFFDNDPLDARHGSVVRAAYDPQRTPDDQLAYRLVARLNEAGEGPLPRIGLRGTVKVHGERVRLFFYLFRRPITALRQRLGW